MYFEYGEKEINYLKKKDKKLGEAIDKIGMVERIIDSDIFSAIIRAILGQLDWCRVFLDTKINHSSERRRTS